MREEAAVDYLWQADGPEQGSRGVCGDQVSARAKAEGCMNEQGATMALIREAVPGLTAGLDDGWCPTGDAWRAEFGDDGSVVWAPVKVIEAIPEPGVLRDKAAAEMAIGAWLLEEGGHGRKAAALRDDLAVYLASPEDRPGEPGG